MKGPIINYAQHYTNLINRALNRPANPILLYEKHHIHPRSQGGKDEPGNIAFLTPKEHYTAHLLLFRMSGGDRNQIFSLKCFLDDAINPRSHRFGLFRWKKWLRRTVAYQSAANMRAIAKEQVSIKYLEQLDKLVSGYEKTIRDIEEKYAMNIATTILDEAFGDLDRVPDYN